MSLIRLRAIMSQIATYTSLISTDFEVGTPGNEVTDFTNPGTYADYSTEQANSGTQSAKYTIRAGDNGSGEFGGFYDFGTDLVKNDEFWFRFKLFVPTGFNWNSDFKVKFLRLRVTTSGGGHLGYIDWYLNSDGTSRLQNELNQTNNQDANASFPLVFNAWQDIEMYCKFHESAGIYRMWHNEDLILDATGLTTLINSTDKAVSQLTFSYWNGGCPLQTTSVSGTYSAAKVPAGSNTYDFNDNGASADTIVATVGSPNFVTQGFAAGMHASVTGTATMNGNYTIDSVTETTLTLPTGALPSGGSSGEDSVILRGTERITGGTSGAYGYVQSIETNDVFIKDTIVGTFSNGETLTGSFSGATATLDFATQSVYQDDAIITSETPDTVDGSGNARIGTAKTA